MLALKSSLYNSLCLRLCHHHRRHHHHHLGSGDGSEQKQQCLLVCFLVDKVVIVKANGLKEQNFGQTNVAARTDEGGGKS